jgi:flagellar motor protein MotB
MTLNEEKDRMKVLAGLKTSTEVIEEGLLANIAAGLGLTLATFTSALAQTGNFDKLKYSDDKKQAIEQAMEDPAVQSKLKELGVPDNNIDRQIKHLKGKRITGYTTRTAHSDKDLQRFLKLGYHLTSVDRDIVIKTLTDTVPSEDVTSLPITLDENEAMFQSGKFQLQEQDISNIKHILDSLESSNSVLLNVSIISSTDGQRLSGNLKKSLTSLGYTPNNEGLSHARAETLEKALENLGVDKSIISEPKILFKDDGVIDQGYRYVIAILDVVQLKPAAPQVKTSTTQDVVPAYKLIKPVVKKHKRFRLGTGNTIIKHYHPAHTAVDKCFFPVPGK